MKTYIMAIDQGTTSTRAILFDHEKRIVAISQKETNLFYPQPGWVEQDANEIYLSVLAVCMDVVSKARISLKELGLQINVKQQFYGIKIQGCLYIMRLFGNQNRQMRSVISGNRRGMNH